MTKDICSVDVLNKNSLMNSTERRGNFFIHLFSLNWKRLSRATFFETITIVQLVN